MNTKVPDYYHFLGLCCHEEDLELIKTAIRQRAAYIRHNFSTQQPEASKELLDQLAEAKRILLSPRRKVAYDKELQSSQTPCETFGSTKGHNDQSDLARPLDSKLAVASRERISDRAISRRFSQRRGVFRFLFLIASGGVAGTAGGIAILWYSFGIDPLGLATQEKAPIAEQATSNHAPPVATNLSSKEHETLKNSNRPGTSLRESRAFQERGPMPARTQHIPASALDLPKSQDMTKGENVSFGFNAPPLPHPGKEESRRVPNPSSLATGEKHLAMLAQAAADRGDQLTANRLFEELKLEKGFDKGIFDLRSPNIAITRRPNALTTEEPPSPQSLRTPLVTQTETTPQSKPEGSGSTNRMDPVLLDFSKRNYVIPIVAPPEIGSDEMFVEILGLEGSNVPWTLEPDNGRANVSEMAKVQLQDSEGTELRVSLKTSQDKIHVYIAAYYKMNKRWYPLTIKHVTDSQNRLERTFAQNKRLLASSRSSLGSLSSSHKSTSSRSTANRAQAHQKALDLSMLRSRIKKQQSTIRRLETSLPITEQATKRLAELVRLGNRMHKQTRLSFRVASETNQGNTITLLEASAPSLANQPVSKAKKQRVTMPRKKHFSMPNLAAHAPLATGSTHLGLLAESAADSGDLATAFRLVMELSRDTDFEEIEFCTRLLKRTHNKTFPPATCRKIAIDSLHQANSSRDKGQTILASECASLALKAARRANDRPLINQATLLINDTHRN